MHEGARKAQPLLHAAGEQIHIAVPLVLQVDQFQQGVDHIHALPVAKSIAARVKIQILPGLQPIVHAKEIRHIAHQAVNLPGLALHIHPVQQSAPAAGLHQRGQDAHGGGFARAVGAHKAMQLAVVNRHAQMIQRQKLPVVARELFQNQHYCALPSSVSTGISMLVY